MTKPTDEAIDEFLYYLSQDIRSPQKKAKTYLRGALVAYLEKEFELDTPKAVEALDRWVFFYRKPSERS
jgi:hypothetical protein